MGEPQQAARTAYCAGPRAKALPTLPQARCQPRPSQRQGCRAGQPWSRNGRTDPARRGWTAPCSASAAPAPVTRWNRAAPKAGRFALPARGAVSSGTRSTRTCRKSPPPTHVSPERTRLLTGRGTCARPRSCSAHPHRRRAPFRCRQQIVGPLGSQLGHVDRIGQRMHGPQNLQLRLADRMQEAHGIGRAARRLHLLLNGRETTLQRRPTVRTTTDPVLSSTPSLNHWSYCCALLRCATTECCLLF